MVEAIVAKGGDYCIAIKGNQESLLSDARVRHLRPVAHPAL